MKNKRILLSIFYTLIINTLCFGQTGTPPPFYASNPSQAIVNSNFAWYRGGNFPGGQAGTNNILGTRWASNIWIMGNNEVTAFFSHNNGLNGINGTGDGLRITNSFSGAIPGLGEIDIFTSGTGSNGTEIRWGGSGNIAGRNNRFEIWGNYNGLFYNTSTGSGVHKFARSGAVTGFIGTNNFWLIGAQSDAANLNGSRRLHVFDAQAQMRLSFGGQNSPNGVFTDFLSNSNGNLQILPQGGRVGINLNVDPQANIDVNGDARIRNVLTATPDALFVGVRNGGNSNDLSVRRLDFTGNAGQVLLGNGTWGAAPTAVTANNGLLIAGGNVQLGAPCNSLIPLLTSSFTSSRALFLNGNSFWLFSGAGQNGGVGLGAQPASAGLCGVGNTVEISANNQSAYGNTNASGLRFTRLTSVSPTVANGINGVDNSKVLTVDQNGDVVLTDNLTGGVGNYCGATANPLTDNYEVPLNGFNYHFTGQGGNGVNNVAIGWPCGVLPPFTPPQAKLDVLEQGYYQTFGAASSIAGRFWSQAPSGVIASYGVMGLAQGGNTNIGVIGQASGGAVNYAGYFSGDVFVNGGANSGTGYLIASDAQFKNDVNDMSDALDIIGQLEPKTYFLDTLNPYGMNFSSKKQYGLIAQEVEQILPELVGENTKPEEYDSLGNVIHQEVTYKNLNYTAFIPIIIAGMQEQQEELDEKDSIINDLNNRLTQLENCLSGILPFLCQLNNSAIAPTQEDVQRELAKAIDVQLSDKNNIILNQNVPNPFAEKTVISYSIPETVGKAQIHFYDGKGTLINTVDIVERGSGEINVYANDLSSGVYTYSLVADGQIVSTKRMMKQ